jgi:hypothetical protein
MYIVISGEAMVFRAIFNNISAMSCKLVLLVEETWVPRENHRPVASHWQTLSHNVISKSLYSWNYKGAIVVVIVC